LRNRLIRLNRLDQLNQLDQKSVSRPRRLIS
jgi:hypothetical protein